MVVPTMLGRNLDAMDAQGVKLPHLRALSYGGGRMPLAVIERAMKKLPLVAFVNAYGLTETSSTIAVLGPEDQRLAFSSDEPRVRAVGLSWPPASLAGAGNSRSRRQDRIAAVRIRRGLRTRRAGCGRVSAQEDAVAGWLVRHQ